jgi:hypothetical protein
VTRLNEGSCIAQYVTYSLENTVMSDDCTAVLTMSMAIIAQ